MEGGGRGRIAHVLERVEHEVHFSVFGIQPLWFGNSLAGMDALLHYTQHGGVSGAKQLRRS